MKRRLTLTVLSVALAAALALILAVAVAQDEGVPEGFNQATVDAAVEELFAATAEAQATHAAQMAQALPATATVQAAFDAALTTTAEANMMEFLYSSIALDSPAAFDYPTHHTEDGDPAVGAEDALVTITEYSDFSCGYCRRFFAQTLPLILDQYGDRVRFVYRDFPILGEGSGTAAVAAECADEQGRFWEYHNYLFANGGRFDNLSLMAMAYKLDLDLEAFEVCLTSDAMLEEIQVDFEAARNLGATGTPSFTINDEFFVGAQPFEEFQRIIEAQLELAHNPPTTTAAP